MPKIVRSKKNYKYQIDIETDGFGIPFARQKERQGIESLTTGKGGVKKGETRN